MGRWEILETIDPGSMGLAEVEAALAAVARLAADAEKLLNRLSARASVLGASVETVVRSHGGRTNRECRQVAARGEAVAAQPVLGDLPSAMVDAAARAASSLSASERREFFAQVPDVAATCATPETGQRRFAKLADRVRTQSHTDRLEAQRSAVTASRGIDPATGMYWMKAQFDPETGASVFAKWDAAVSRRASKTDGSHDAHAMGWALVDMLLESGGGRPGAEVNLLVDAATLAGHAHPGSVHEIYDGADLPALVIERLGCVADFAVHVVNEHGTVVDHGRRKRLPTESQRDWLRARYQGCGWPGCDAAWSSCEIHHVKFWRDLGATDIDNLIPLCRRHHHDVHDRNWHLTLKPDRSCTIRDPHGRVETHGPPEAVFRVRATAARCR